MRTRESRVLCGPGMLGRESRVNVGQTQESALMPLL